MRYFKIAVDGRVYWVNELQVLAAKTRLTTDQLANRKNDDVVRMMARVDLNTNTLLPDRYVAAGTAVAA